MDLAHQFTVHACTRFLQTEPSTHLQKMHNRCEVDKQGTAAEGMHNTRPRNAISELHSPY